MNKAIRIVLVDGSELVRHGLRHMLEPEEDMQVVGDYTSADEALIEMARLPYDIVLMGTKMPGMSWIEATRGLKRNGLHHSGDVIILAESLDYRAKAMEAGAAVCLLKDVACVELTQTIRQVYQNRRVSKEGYGFIEEAVELVIPSSAGAAQLMRFMCQLAEILTENFASIICTVGSWERGTDITIRQQSAMSSRLLFQLANIPEVDKVEEKPPARSALSSITKKRWFLPGLKISHGKRLYVTLKEADVVRQDLATVVN